MRKLITILFAFFSTFASGQVYFSGDSIHIEEPVFSGQTDWLIHIQNADNLSQSVYYWSDTGKEVLFSPWCNIRISRTAFDYQLQAFPEWEVTLTKVDVSLKVSSMPGRRFVVEVKGGNFDIQTKHSVYGGWQTFYENSMQYYPTATNQSEGTHTYFVPYRIPGQNVAVVKIHAAGCTQQISRIFFLN